MKLSFSIPSKTSYKSNPIKPSQNFDEATTTTTNIKDGNVPREYVTEFDASKSPSDPNKSANIVIPPIQNEWRPHKRMKNLELPITDSSETQLGFELDTSSAADEPGSGMSFGLNLRQTIKHDEDGKQSAAGSGMDDDNGRTRPVPVEAVLLQKFKDDMIRLPDDQGFEEFKDVPVEGFGAALLAGYGWCEGRGIGKNAKEDVKVKQYEKRAGKEGLGFVSDHAPTRSSKRVERNKEHGRDDSSVGKTIGRDDSSVGKTIGRDDSFSVEKIVGGEDPLVGKTVRIVGGKEAGVKGRIIRKIEDDWVVLKLGKSDEKVKVSIDDIAELGSVEEERCLKKLKELKIQAFDKDKDSKTKRSRDEGRRGHREVEVKQKYINGDSPKEEQGKKQISWLTSHIRVRVISKHFKGGRFYLNKGEVLDVVGPSTCDLSMDDSKEIIQGVSQDFLETAIPRRGGPVLILCGKHKGVYGSLVERDLEREIGVVRDADTHNLLNVRLEQIAEYIGDPSLLGY